MSGADADELFGIFADPAIWWFDPTGVHADVATTRAYLDRAGSRWADDGLSYWTVRLRSTGQVLGSGGAQRHRGGEWNLNYRLAVDEPSIRVARRAGLVSRGLRAGTYDGRPRLAFADRPLDEDTWPPVDPVPGP